MPAELRCTNVEDAAVQNSYSLASYPASGKYALYFVVPKVIDNTLDVSNDKDCSLNVMKRKKRYIFCFRARHTTASRSIFRAERPPVDTPEHKRLHAVAKLVHNS